MKSIKTLLSYSLMAISAITFINIVILYWIPIILPLSLFSNIRLMFIAFIDKKYYFIPICLLICILIFITAISVKKQQVVLPAFITIYFIFDFTSLIILIIEDLIIYNYFAVERFIQLIIDILIICLMIIYIVLYIKKNKKT